MNEWIEHYDFFILKTFSRMFLKNVFIIFFFIWPQSR